MTKQAYKAMRFSTEALDLIDKLDRLMRVYKQQGYKLTVRQLYYQLVTKNYIANDERNYKKVARILNDGRLAGLIDWEMIEDRTREFDTRSRWTSPNDILVGVASQYHQDLWDRQRDRVYIIIEKEALASVFERVCREMDVPLLCARGYPSVSVLREFAQYELLKNHDNGQGSVLLHFGDHDPSGLDMTRDLEERLTMFTQHITGDRVEIHRLALNMDQVEEYSPPPNPAKTTDARFQSYCADFGNESWELDALSPSVLTDLVRENVSNYIDEDNLEITKREIEFHKNSLRELAESHEFPSSRNNHGT